MKDPLQTEATHYEVLGVKRQASSADIENAFRAGIVKHANVQKLLSAKQALQQASERAMLDLFYYNPQVLARLNPNPLQDPAHLQPAQRARTAVAWETQLKANFPDAGIAHCLGLLWYWWAISEEVRQADVRPADALATDQVWEQAIAELWEQAIAYWAMVVASLEFWDAPTAVAPELAKELPGRVVQRLRNHLLDLAQKHRNKRFHDLDLALTTEVHTAKEIANAGVKTATGAIACGPLLLHRMGLLDSIRQQINSTLQKQPGNDKLKTLRDALSPFFSIAILLDQKKPEHALEALEALPASTQALPEVSRLLARAHLEFGRQKASLGQAEEALENWESALCCENADDIATDVRREVVSVCQARAVAWQSTERDRAILLLEKGLKFVEDQNLKLTLAELLTSRAIESINVAQKRVDAEKSGATPKFFDALEKAHADLERAKKLGSARAAEQSKAAQQLIEQAKSGFLDISEEARSLVRSANDAAGDDNWEKAIDLLKKALKISGSQGEPALRKLIAQYLNASAVHQINRFTRLIEPAMKKHQEQIPEMVKSFLHIDLLDFAKSGKLRSSESWVEHYLASMRGIASHWWIISIIFFTGVTAFKENDWKLSWTSGIFLGAFVIGFAVWGVIWLGKKMVEILTSMPSTRLFPQQNATLRCALCANDASYQFELPEFPQMPLCSSHANKLRSITNSVPEIPPSTLNLLVAAAANLEEAGKLDSSLGQIRENRRQVDELLSRFKPDKPDPILKEIEDYRRQLKEVISRSENTKSGPNLVQVSAQIAAFATIAIFAITPLALDTYQGTGNFAQQLRNSFLGTQREDKSPPKSSASNGTAPSRTGKSPSGLADQVPR